jgi:hypothetical protein
MASATPLTRDEVLDQLRVLATVEHALIVEYLSVQCALGHNLPADEGGGATEELRAVANLAGNLAQDEMRHLRLLHQALADAGHPAQVERAVSIASDSVAEVALGPPSAAQLERLFEREQAIAKAVDERFARLVPAVTTDPVFDGGLLGKMRSVVEHGQRHTQAVEALRPLWGLEPAAFLRATRREPRDEFERHLLSVSKRTYNHLVAIVQKWFEEFSEPEPPFFSPFQGWAVDTMFTLDEIDSLLVRRGLLPSFELP